VHCMHLTSVNRDHIPLYPLLHHIIPDLFQLKLLLHPYYLFGDSYGTEKIFFNLGSLGIRRLYTHINTWMKLTRWVS